MMTTSFFDEFARMQRQMDRMMRSFDSQFAPLVGDMDNDLWSMGAGFEQPTNLLGGGNVGQQQQLTSGKGGLDEKTTDSRLTTTGGTQGKQQGGQLTTQGATGSSLTPWRGGVGGLLNINAPKVDIIERPDRYVVNAEVAGIPKENLKVDLNQDTGVLTLSGHHQEQKEERDGDRWVRRERSSGTFTRSMRLPNDVKKEGMSARLENGILCIDLPKVPGGDKKLQSRQQSIQIQ